MGHPFVALSKTVLLSEIEVDEASLMVGRGIQPAYIQSEPLSSLSVLLLACVNLVGAWALLPRVRDETILKYAGD